MTTHQHAQAAADLYRKLIIAARDYPYRDFKDTLDEFLGEWFDFRHTQNDLDSHLRLYVETRKALEDAELDLLGGTGKLPNLFPVGHPRC